MELTAWDLAAIKQISAELNGAFAVVFGLKDDDPIGRISVLDGTCGDRTLIASYLPGIQTRLRTIRSSGTGLAVPLASETNSLEVRNWAALIVPFEIGRFSAVVFIVPFTDKQEALKNLDRATAEVLRSRESDRSLALSK